MFQVGIHLTNAALVHLRLGEYEQAFEQFERGLELKIRVGDRVGQGFNLYNLGLIDMYFDRHDDAKQLLHESLVLRREINDERGVTYSLHGLGLLALKAGHYDDAEDYFQQAYDASVRLGIKAEAILNLSYLGQARLRLDSLEEARTVSDQAVKQKETIEVAQEQRIFFNHFMVLAAQDDPNTTQYLQRAYDELMTRANRISDPARRHTYLKRVRANRVIIDEMNSGNWDVQLRDAALP
jgi:tetratricopeptide (TPR) repeat protein